MIDNKNIHEQIIYIVKKANDLECNDIEIGPNTNLINDLGFSSLTLIHLVVQLENTFGISVDDDDMRVENFADIKTIESYVIDKLVAK